MNKKKVAFFGAWIALMIILVIAVNFMGSGGGTPKIRQASTADKPVPPPPDKGVLTKNWKSILAMASPARGKTDAPYTMVEFGDFECPLCGMERAKIETLVSKTPMNMYFVNRPFPKAHPNAVAAAQAALSAESQKKFWPMYDSLYSHQKQLDAAHYALFADQIGIDGKKVAGDVKANAYLGKVQSSLAFCDSIGVTATPTVVVRDNRTGLLTIARTDDEITKLVHEPRWSAAAGKSTSSTKGAAESTKVANE